MSYIKQVAELAIPMAFARLIYITGGFIAMLMIAQLGHDYLAAGALIFSIQISLIVIPSSLLFSISVMVGRFHGEENHQKVSDTIHGGFALAALIALPISFAYWHIEHLLVFFKQSPTIIPIVKSYFQSAIFAVIPVYISGCLQQFGFALLKQRIILISSSMTLAVVILASYSLIFGHFGFPAYGIKGFAYAITLQNWMNLFLLFYFLVNDHEVKHYRLLRQFSMKIIPQMKALFQLGWPISVQVGGEILYFLVITMMIGWLGDKPLAASQVVGQCRFLILIPMFGISQAAGILVGRAYGAKEFHSISKIAYQCLAIGICFIAIFAVLFVTIPDTLASFYLDLNKPSNQFTLQLIVYLFIITAISQFFDASRNIMTGALRGLYDTRFPMWISFLLLWGLGLPLVYYFGFTLHWGVIGIAIATSLAIIIGCGIILWRWETLSRRAISHAVISE